MPSGSIDVTKRCNLRCEHCYFFAEEHKERELTVDEWIEHFEAMKAAGDPMLLCTWVGGEPMVRKEVIDSRTLSISNTTRSSPTGLWSCLIGQTVPG
jgi:MoaA/NifB/PqqE/SkfB family radical SAM enzyme